MQKIRIAIDGPAGAGKSTIAKMAADRLHYLYIDTGAMYRAVTLKALVKAISMQDEKKLGQLAAKTDVLLEDAHGKTRVFMDGSEVTEEIRTPEVSGNVSFVAKVPGVRLEMVRLQREMAKVGGVVMDGRDIGTYVLPDAEVKIFLTASVEERARRRYLELLAKGFDVTMEQLVLDIARRDKIDSEREMAPLKQAEDAILLDTSDMSIEQVVDRVLEIAKEGGAGDI